MTLDMKLVAEIAAPILRETLDPYGLEDVRFDPDVDHDGDPVIRASLTYRSGAEQPPAARLIEAMNDIMSRLAERGDERFLHLRHMHPPEAGDRADDWLEGGRRKRA